MDQTQLDLGPHGAGFTGQGDDLSFASAAALHGVSGGLRPPQPTPTTSTKLRRRSFVPPAPWPSAPAPPRPSAPAPPIVDGTRRQLSFSIPAVPPALDRQASSLSLFPMPDLIEQPSSRCHAAAWEAFETTVDNNLIPIQNPIFDWTPTSMTSNHSEDTRPSTSSQYFTNLMIQDQDADLELLIQSDPTLAIVAKGPSKRGTSYSHYEDIQLYKSWLNISNDPIIRTDQSGKTYWERIARDFHQNIYSKRTTNSLEHRCGVIIRDCMKFHGYFEEVQRRHQSGIPEQEHLLQAQARYAKNLKGKNCPFIHCWLVVRHSEKFEALEMNKRSGKSRGLNLSGESNESQQQDGGEQEPNLGQQDSIPNAKKARPPGRKQSKEKLKRDEGNDEYKTLMKNLVVIKNGEHSLRKERWTKDLSLEQRRLEIEERKLQWDQEKQIMFCDVNTLEDDKKNMFWPREHNLRRWQ